MLDFTLSIKRRNVVSNLLVSIAETTLTSRSGIGTLDKPKSQKESTMPQLGGNTIPYTKDLWREGGMDW